MVGEEKLILYRFETGYVKTSRYLTKPEIKQLVKIYGKWRGYCIPADLILEFAVCELFERAIEKWMAQGGQSLCHKHQATQEIKLANQNYTRPYKEVKYV